MLKRVCIVGLGNPGPRYDGTRHNIGFNWVDSVAKKLFPQSQFKTKYQSEWLQVSHSIKGDTFDLHLLKPQTYMNESGKACAEWKQKNQGESLWLVVYDDMDLPLGKLRLRASGSDGGHRGMRSIIERLGTNAVARLRLGISRPQVDGVREETLDHVLERFNPEEKKVIFPMLEDAASQLEAFLSHDFDKAMNIINSKNFGLEEKK